MKVLILSLASTKDPWKYIREEGQEKTWDSIEVDNVQTLYYFSHPFKSYLYKNHLHLHCPDDFLMMHWRLKLALDYVWDMEWDYIFRISASSYVDKELLLKKAESLPKEKCYCGIQCCGGSVASGCGFFMSRDVVQILRDKIPMDMGSAPYGVHPDDVLIGRILESEGIYVTPGAERFDYWHPPTPRSLDDRTYHWRCKDDNAPNDGKHDVNAMQVIFRVTR